MRFVCVCVLLRLRKSDCEWARDVRRDTEVLIEQFFREQAKRRSKQVSCAALLPQMVVFSSYILRSITEHHFSCRVTNIKGAKAGTRKYGLASG